MHQLPSALALPKLEEQRNWLLRFLETQKPQGSLNNKITVVFDGKADIFGGMDSVMVKVVFSKDETADEKIKRMVETAGNTKNIVVVTNDRAIQYAVRASGAKVSSVEQFLNAVTSEKGSVFQQQSGKKDSKEKIPRNLENKITSEMEEVWLKKKP